MNDKLIIEKQAEIIKTVSSFLKLIGTNASIRRICQNNYAASLESITERVRQLESELSLLEQNKGKEMKGTVGSADVEELISLYANRVNYALSQDRVKSLLTNLITEFEALEKRDHSASPTMSNEINIEINNAIEGWLCRHRLSPKHSRELKDRISQIVYINSKSEE